MAAKKQTNKAPKKQGPYVIARCRDAGVHAGVLVKNGPQNVTLIQSRRIWYWNGAASLSELAVYGVNPNKSSSCRFAVRIDKPIHLRTSDVCELLECSAEARASIEGIVPWRA